MERYLCYFVNISYENAVLSVRYIVLFLAFRNEKRCLMRYLWNLINWSASVDTEFGGLFYEIELEPEIPGWNNHGCFFDGCRTCPGTGCTR